MEGFGKGKNIWVVSRDDFLDVGGPILVEEGSYIERVGGDRAVGWAGVWMDVSRQEEQEGSDKGGAWLRSRGTMCQEEVGGWNCEEVAVLRCGSWSLLTGYRVGGLGGKGVCRGRSEEEAESDGGEDEEVTI
jgi:hypothetical protein